MELSLNSDMQKLIDERVKVGKYASAEDVVTAALLTLDQQERFGDFEPGELDGLLAEGEKSIASEGTLDGEEAFRLRGDQRRHARRSAP